MTHLLKKYRWEALLIVLLTLMEAGLSVLFPLFIGYAIDDALAQEYRGAILLGTLGFVILLMGAGRRFYDSRFYAKLYQETGVKVASGEKASTSTKSAHLGFLGEVIEFFENSLPEIVNSVIALAGTMIVIATMDIQVFVGCLICILVVIVVYGLSVKKTTTFNASYNEELEKQVEMVSGNNPVQLNWHLQKLMKWNIKLSDLETLNFSMIWLVMLAFLIGSIFLSVDGSITHGLLFSMVLYLFQFMEQVTVMPLFYQQWLRLKGMIGRLNGWEKPPIVNPINPI